MSISGVQKKVTKQEKKSSRCVVALSWILVMSSLFCQLVVLPTVLPLWVWFLKNIFSGLFLALGISLRNRKPTWILRLSYSPFLQDIVNVDFEFFDLKPDDFHGTKALLRTYLDNVLWDINGFVELFLAQTTVGSVVKTAEESPIGIISTLNLARYHDSACMKQVQQFLERKSSERPEAKQLKKFWTKTARDVGLLVRERLINIPMDLVPPL